MDKRPASRPVWRTTTAALLALAAASRAPAAPLNDVVTSRQGDVTTLRIPSGGCTSVRATPIVIGDHLVLAMYGTLPCSTPGRYDQSLLSYHLKTGQLEKHYDNVGTEGTLLYRPDRGLVFWNLVFGGSLRIVDLASGRIDTAQPAPRATSDGAGAYLDGHYVFSTINTPEAGCQSPVNEDCGVLLKVDTSGRVQARLDRSRGFRSWVAAGISTDGSHLYAGGSEQWLGSSDSQYAYGCSLVKLDGALNIVASYDPGDRGCWRSGRGGNDEDAVTGELVLGRDDVWAQWKSPTAADRQSSLLVRLDRQLRELCRVEKPTGPFDSTAYYGGVTLDKDGNAWVPLTLHSGGQRYATLLKVTRDCQATTVAQVAGASAKASPTLVDDRWVLFATDGRVAAYQQRDGAFVGALALASAAAVSAAPVLVDGKVFVVQEDATLTVVEGLGLQGYGQAIWPRYRRNNHGDPSREGGVR